MVVDGKLHSVPLTVKASEVLMPLLRCGCPLDQSVMTNVDSFPYI